MEKMHTTKMVIVGKKGLGGPPGLTMVGVAKIDSFRVSLRM